MAVLLILPLMLVLSPVAIAADDGPRRVVVISLDGARPDALRQVPTPNITALAERGSATWAARTTFPPVTVPAHTSMLTGLDIDEHRVVWNSYAETMVSAPTFLTVAEQHGYRAAIAAGKNKLQQLQQSEDIPFAFGTAGDASVIDAAIDLLDEGYEVLFVHLPNPDYFGHLRGWMSDSYLHELTNTDRQVGRLLKALDERNLLDETLVILTADHGGTGNSHGRDIPEHMLIPWVIAGPGVQQGADLGSDVFVGDTAATVLCALGLPTPDSKRAQPVFAAFAPGAACTET